GRQSFVGRLAAVARILIYRRGQFYRLVLVEHGKRQRLWIALVPEIPLGHQSCPWFQTMTELRTLKSLPGQAGVKGAVVPLHDHDAVAPSIEAVVPLRPKAACVTGVRVVNEHSPTIAQDAMGIEEKANGDGAVIGVAIAENLPPAKHAVIRAQVLLAAIGLKQAM